MSDSAAPAPAPTPSNESTPSVSPSQEQLRRALKAFRKRLKFARLDDESRLGHGPMSKGGRSGIVAISPPFDYPVAVWEALVEEGKLRRAGHGLYELVEQ